MERTIRLPPPPSRGTLSLEEALFRRRSIREFDAGELDLAKLSRLLWSAQGETGYEGDRTAPSAGGLQPLELYVILPAGLYRYDPSGHRLELHGEGDLRREAWRAAFHQDCVAEAPAVVVIAGVIARTATRYGKSRAARYVYMEAGHAAQNLLLQAVSLGLGAVPVGAFEDSRLGRVLALPRGQTPLYLLPVGVPR